MNCPSCKHKLDRVEFEGLIVHQCPECLGHLVTDLRFGGVKLRQELSTEELVHEAKNEADEDSVKSLHCPACGQGMTKKPLQKVASASNLDLETQVDICASCKQLWFDGGELALAQLAYESTDRAIDAKEFKRRLDEMSPQRKAEFRQNLARLQGGAGDLLSAAVLGASEEWGK